MDGRQPGRRDREPLHQPPKGPAGEPRPTHNGQLAGLPYHCHALALYFVWYNWIRIHKTLRVMPAMAAGLTDKVMDMTAWWR